MVHDELDLPFGRLQLKTGGGTGGHNGLESIVEQLGDDRASPGSASASASPRARTPRSGWWATCSTTSRPRRRDGLPPLLERAVDMARAWVSLGLAEAMNRHNRR